MSCGITFCQAVIYCFGFIANFPGASDQDGISGYGIVGAIPVTV